MHFLGLLFPKVSQDHPKSSELGSYVDDLCETQINPHQRTCSLFPLQNEKTVGCVDPLQSICERRE